MWSLVRDHAYLEMGMPLPPWGDVLHDTADLVCKVSRV